MDFGFFWEELGVTLPLLSSTPVIPSVDSQEARSIGTMTGRYSRKLA